METTEEVNKQTDQLLIRPARLERDEDPPLERSIDGENFHFSRIL